MSSLAAALNPAMVADMLSEIEDRNHVRVVKFEACRAGLGGHVFRKRVLDELAGPGKACGLGALMLGDHARMLRGKDAVYLKEAFRRLGAELRSVTPNLRTTVGADFAAAQLGGTSVAVADYIALSNNTRAIAAGDSSSTLPWSLAQAVDAAAGTGTGEYTALGVARAQATYAHTGGTAAYSMTKTWTATGAVTALSVAGLFGGAGKTAQGSGATNILFLENTFTPTTLAINDQLQLVWTVNI